MGASTTERAGSVEFRVLGNVEVVVDGQPLALEGRKSRELLAYLLLHANESVPQRRIVEAVWGEEPPLTVDASLRVAVSKLRKALEPIGARDRLETRPSAYVLRVEPESLDAGRFDALASEGRRALEVGLFSEADAQLREALSLWRGTPFNDVAACEEAATEERRLASRRLDAEDDLSDAQLALGGHETLVHTLETLVAQQPARERRAAQLMLALYRSGRQAEALEVYVRIRASLNEELGLEPGPELRDLQQAILRQDPVLAAPRSRPETTGRRAKSGPRDRRLLLVLALVIIATIVAVVFAWIVVARSEAPVHAPANSVAIVDLDDSRVAEWAPTGSRPADVALAHGSAWIANADEGTVTQVDVESREVVRTIGIGFEPTGIDGDDVAVWVVGGYERQLARIDTNDGRVRLRIRFTERLGPLPQGYERGPAGVAAGADGVWVSHGVELTRFDPRTGAVERTVRAGGPWVPQIAVAEGFVWVALDGELTAAGSLRSEPALEAVSLEGDRRARVPLAGLASDVEVADGYAWVAIQRGDSVWRIDAKAMTVDATMRAGDSPASLAIDGGVWVSNSADATVTGLDERTGAKIAVIPVGHTLEGLAAADGEVWVTVRAP